VEILPPRSLTRRQFRKISIYRDHPFGIVVAANVQLHGIRMGLDKLSHFRGGGFIYFKQYNDYIHKYKRQYDAPLARRKAFEEAIDLGIKSEHSLLGTRGTGVFSYADLEANFQGLKLLLNLCLDPEPGSHPYLSQVTRDGKKQWVLAKSVNMARYFNPSFDEFINPSVFSDKVWPTTATQLKKYCPQLHTPAFADFYPADLFQAPSANRLYLQRLINHGTLVDPTPYSLKTLCQ
jgi:hypothetical protein